MKNKYRVVKITRMNGESNWAVQKQYHHWLTGKEIWKYYADYACDSMYTRDVNFAEMFLSEKTAMSKMNSLIMSDNRAITNIEVVLEESNEI